MTNKIETQQEINVRLAKAKKYLLDITGKVISPSQAKKMHKLAQYGYRITEIRLNDELTMVIMRETMTEPSYDFSPPKVIQFEGDERVFLVRGKLGKKLHMN